MSDMPREKRDLLLGFILATLAGTALHFLYPALPTPLTAVLAPVNESIWEHGKLVYWPGLLAALWLAKGHGRLGARLLALLAGFVLLLTLGYVYNIALGGESHLVNILCYVGVMALVFWLPGPLDRRLRGRLGELFLLLTIALGAAIWLFTFLPPAHILYMDPSAYRTFLILPL